MTTKTLHVWVDEAPISGGVRRDVHVEHRDGDLTIHASNLWFEIVSSGIIPAAETLNFAVCALVFEAMREGRTMHVHGPVSTRLLANLEDFQFAFKSWLPALQRVDILADEEVAVAVTDRPAIVAFSGGVDALFSYYRHTNPYETRFPKKVGAILLAHGFDLRLSSEDGFATARRTAERILGDDPVERIWLKTNIREGGFIGSRKSQRIEDRWTLTFGAALAACFHQMEAGYSSGLIGSDEPYNLLAFPWGSNPVTNHLLSSERMDMVYDGGGYGRTAKVAALSGWPVAMENLRVCYAKPHGKNCCRCEKCVRTILNIRVLGLPLPPSFPHDATDDQVREIPIKGKVQQAYISEIIGIAEANGINESWVDAARDALARSKSKTKPAPKAVALI